MRGQASSSTSVTALLGDAQRARRSSLLVDGSPTATAISSVDWDAEAAVTQIGALGKVSIGDIAVTGSLDAQTPLLRTAIDRGQVLNTVVVCAQATSTSPATEYALTRAAVSELDVTGSGGELQTAHFAVLGTIRVTTTLPDGRKNTVTYDTQTVKTS